VRESTGAQTSFDFLAISLGMCFTEVGLPAKTITKMVVAKSYTAGFKNA
jgi:hypothetical protein